MNSKSRQDKKNIEVHLDRTLKNVWVDNLHLSLRDDGICVVRFATNLPEGNFEQVRVMTSTNQLKEFIDVLCSSTNYYPAK